MAEATKKINFWDFTHYIDRQEQAHEAVEKYKYILYGGAMGGGKSYWIRWELIYLLLRFWQKYDLRGVRVGLFCEDYPSLKDRQIARIKYEFPQWLGGYNKADHEFTLSPPYGSGVLCFRNLDDPSKYQSAEFAAIGIDELTKNRKEVFDFLRTRLRWSGIGDVKFIAGTNPGGIGHDWVKKLWMNKVYEPNEQEKDQFYFIPAKATDNPYLDKSYFKSLEGLPEMLRKAYVEGRWDLFAGQFFKEWNGNIHIAKEFDVPRGFEKLICGDYGFTAPSAVYWLAWNPYDSVQERKIYVYKELYQTGLTYKALAEEVISMTAERNIQGVVFDPSIFSKSGETGKSGGDTMKEIFKRMGWNLEAGNNDRMAGWTTFRDYLKLLTDKDGKETSRFQVLETCPNLIRTLPEMIFNERKKEDLDTDGEDHSADAVRYGLMKLMAGFKKIYHKEPTKSGVKIFYPEIGF